MPARLKISLENLKNNIEEIEKIVNKNKSKTELLVMVKADAYGAGATKVALYLQKLGIKNFGVAYLKEAKELRNAGIKENIIVFSGILPDEVDEAVKTNATYAISNIKVAKMLSVKAEKENKKVKVHIALDTGMTRIGITHNNLENYILKIQRLKGIEIDGAFTHFSCADCDIEYTQKQISTFNRCIDLIEKMGIKLKYKHIYNSSAILLQDNVMGNMIRLGICAYGYLPFDNDYAKTSRTALKGIFKLEAPICEIREVEKNVGVSYAKTFITKRRTKIATLQIGYADGLSRSLSNNYSVTINGKECKIVGNICMDMCMVDVTDVDNIEIGDYAVIFDYTDNKVNEIARKTQTINYEILTNIGKRVDRKYE